MQLKTIITVHFISLKIAGFIDENPINSNVYFTRFTIKKGHKVSALKRTFSKAFLRTTQVCS